MKSWLFLFIFAPLLFGATMGALHLRGGKFAYLYLFTYLCASIVFMFLPDFFHVPYSYTLPTEVMYYALACLMVLQIIGPIHCYFIAKKNTYHLSKWYDRWYVLIPFFSFCFLIIFILIISGTVNCAWEDPASDFSCESRQEMESL